METNTTNTDDTNITDPTSFRRTLGMEEGAPAVDQWGNINLGIGRLEATARGGIALTVTEHGSPPLSEVIASVWTTGDGRPFRKAGTVATTADEAEALVDFLVRNFPDVARQTLEEIQQTERTWYVVGSSDESHSFDYHVKAPTRAEAIRKWASMVCDGFMDESTEEAVDYLFSGAECFGARSADQNRIAEVGPTGIPGELIVIERSDLEGWSVDTEGVEA